MVGIVDGQFANLHARRGTEFSVRGVRGKHWPLAATVAERFAKEFPDQAPGNRNCVVYPFDVAKLRLAAHWTPLRDVVVVGEYSGGRT